MSAALVIDQVLGSRVSLADRLHELEHHGAVDYVTIDAADLDRRRLMTKTDRGEPVAIALPRHEKLYDGAVLFLDRERAIVVRTVDRQWLRFIPATREDALELGYSAGNLHWKVRFEAGDLLVALEGPEAAYAARIEPLIASGRVRMAKEPR